MAREIDLSVCSNPDGRLATYSGCNPFFTGVRYVTIRKDGRRPHVSGVYFTNPHINGHEVLGIREAMDTYRFKKFRKVLP
ncbi:MAG: hypothetical protein HYW27_01890 [Candidatus Aenigmarchaeota archaeon]|nr:hypothetical protein [Candidatus Aenigmarchaeota archaeon]